MVRRLLRKLGTGKTLFIIAVISILLSVSLYIIIGNVIGIVEVIGILESIIIPAIVAPSVSYFFLQLLAKLDLAEKALAEVNAELELRVEQRTAELVKANEELQAEITERQQAEEALRESEEEFRAIFDSVGDGIALIDVTGKVIRVNKRITDVGGYAEEEIVGKRIKFLKMFPPRSLAKMLSNFTRLILSGQQIPPFEVEVYTKAGGKMNVELRGSLLRQGGKTVGMVGVMRDITERKQAEEQIKASLREKEVLLKEIHHRVKNNLQTIASLLYLQSKSIKDEELREMFYESRSRIRAMALVHEKLYQSKGLARISLAGYIQDLANYLFRSYGVDPSVIKLRIDADEASSDIDTAVSLGLILHELVSNALRHAFPDGRGGQVRIELRSDHDGELTLVVSDDGVGLPEDLDFRETESLGWQLVNNLVARLEGTIELDRGGGTAVKITVTDLK